jgi:hypothetical protein
MKHFYAVCNGSNELHKLDAKDFIKFIISNKRFGFSDCSRSIDFVSFTSHRERKLFIKVRSCYDYFCRAVTVKEMNRIKKNMGVAK